MRELTQHKINPANDLIDITVLDEPGPGNANHAYELLWTRHGDDTGIARDGVTLHFQNGPIAEVGVNGVTQEALLAVLIDRMEGFQGGPYASDDNAEALKLMLGALSVLHRRTQARMARGVEGTMTV